MPAATPHQHRRTRAAEGSVKEFSLRAIGAALAKAGHAPRGGRWWPNTVLRLLRRADHVSPARVKASPAPAVPVRS